jgi:hypothetical protein
LLLPLASILGIEVDDLIARLRQNTLAWSAVALSALIGVVFLLVALHNAVSDWLGPIWGPLAIAGAALLVALAIYLGMRIAAGIAARRDAQRRHSAERTALVTTAAITAVPMLLKSPLMRSVGIPVGGLLAAAYFLTRPNRRRGNDDEPL